tara:strand:- start:1119 stop:2645 length:1527 start_codon:yes stop_codon:yes gene_type:complete
MSEKFAVWIANQQLDSLGRSYDLLNFGEKDIPKEQRNTRKTTAELLSNTKAVSLFQSNDPDVYRSADYRKVLDWLQYPTTPKQNLRELTMERALIESEEWHDALTTTGGDINYVESEENEIIKTYPVDKQGVEYYWTMIPSNFCDIESSRMGHCGRTGYGNNLISLRSKRQHLEGNTISDSHVTIAYNLDDGIFYQIKGKKNQKPSEKYFDKIYDLILTFAEDDRRNFGGIGAEYNSTDDYGYSDMTSPQIEKLNSLVPYIFKGFVGESTLYNLGIIDTPPNTVVEFQIDSDNLERFLYIYGDINNSVIKSVLSDEFIMDYDPYWHENSTVLDYVDNLNSRNTKDIQEDISNILNLDLEIIEQINLKELLAGDWEDIEQLNGLEHSDYEDTLQYILDSVNRAIGSAEESEYFNMIKKAVIDALEELGEVWEYDGSVTLTHDLDDSLGLQSISDIINEGYVDDDDLDSVFTESLDNGQIEKPTVFIDDRWSPYVNDNDLNINFELMDFN